MTDASRPGSDPLTALRHSHERLVDMVEPLGEDDVTRQSYDDDWSIAQVLSHLGSGAEIFGRYLAAFAAGGEPPTGEQFQPIWDTWNAKSAPEQARDALQVDGEFVATVDALKRDGQDGWQVEMFGMQTGLDDVVRMRLNEHAVHSWDIAVALDPSATIAPESVALLVDQLGQLAAWAGKPTSEPLDVVVRTESPARVFRISSTSEGVRVEPIEDPGASAPASLELPAEAFIRLVYGRLDADHTPALKADGIDLDTLRSMFPGM
ncbi:MAG TPA: maleylpyruvate isomerase family mycothiol-dependent enzyme [Mycobacteriales bacterium]|nr:maleylpyruvate isomerase family mycothiol-dependent enzyme [Mycobacteriales bacterium]